MEWVEEAIARTVVNHKKKGILLWNIGDRSHQTFEPIWQVIKCWQSFWYVTDGWKVYPMYIEPEDHLVFKTYMTRVEGENTRLRHCALERTASEVVESTYVDCSITSKDSLLF